MAFIFKVTFKQEQASKPNYYNITWFDKQTRSQDTFDQSAQELTDDELLHLWHDPRYQ